MCASFRANLAWIHGESAELRACQKVRIDRQTSFHLYMVDRVLYLKQQGLHTYLIEKVCTPKGECIHIRQCMSAYVTTTK